MRLVMINISYENIIENRKVEVPKNLVWGYNFTDHCFLMDYSTEKGWHNARITALKSLDIHPAAMVFHYGQTVFEGLKAYKNSKGEITLFRPQKNIERMNKSCARLVMPQIPEEVFMEAMKKLVTLEKDWIPTGYGEALYIRPVMFATQPALGVKPSNSYLFAIILSPVGAYYPEGFKPVKILVEEHYVRAVKNGLGECKTAANYAASLLAADEAKHKGFSQVLWLDAIERKYLEEVGTMNIFINFDDEIVTPELNGSILHGITRDSVITLLKSWGMNISERRISIDEVIEKHRQGKLKSAFGTGTAAIISPISHFSYKGELITINNGEAGELDKKLFDEISKIQYGLAEDKFGWIIKI